MKLHSLLEPLLSGELTTLEFAAAAVGGVVLSVALVLLFDTVRDKIRRRSK